MKIIILSLLTVLITLAASGCIERKLTITSEPAGALVIISDKEIGRTPVTTHFIWNGEYDIILRYPEEGYETLNEQADINPTWYEIPPLDLLSIIVPWTYPDHRYLHYKLKKAEMPSEKAIIQRAKQMQKRNDMPVKK